MACCDVIDILRTLRSGTRVNVWFDTPTFPGPPFTTVFQFFNDNEAAFTGGSFDGGLTYIQATDIQAIAVIDVNQPPLDCGEGCEFNRRECKKNRNDCFCCDPMTILSKLSRETPVTIWFGNSNFIPATFQFLCGNMAVFSGSTFGQTLYVKVSDIIALTTSRAPSCSTDDGECECEEHKCRKNRDDVVCCNPMAVLGTINPGATVNVWFDASNFRPGVFQCIEDNMAVFTGGSFPGGFTYIKACDIRGIQVGVGLLLSTSEDKGASTGEENVK
jgi:hypothetical protein